jgi:hypothetical protein
VARGILGLDLELEEAVMKRARQLFGLCGNLALACAGIAVALLAGELVVRGVAPQAHPLASALHGLHQPDADLGYVMVPHFRRRIRTHDFECEMITNSMGLRDGEIGARRPGSFRILGLGDSFALGIQAGAAENCFLERLERLLAAALSSSPAHAAVPWREVEVINAGVIGYGTPQEVGYLERLGGELHPDAVLVAFFLGNDFADNSGSTRMTVVDGYHMLEASAEGYRRHFKPLQRRVREYLNAHSELYLVVKRRLLHPTVAFFSGRERRATPRPAGVEERPFDLGLVESMRASLAPGMAAGMEATRLALGRLRRWCDDHGTRVLLVAVPAEQQVSQRARTAWLRALGLENEGLDFGLPNRRLAGLAAEAAVPVCDLTDSLAARIAAGAELYLAGEGHWNAAGHAAAAELLVEPILEHLLVQEPGDRRRSG